MRELFDFAEREDFSQFLEQVMKNPAVQGVTVDVDRTWLRLARAKDRFPPRVFDSWSNLILDSMPYPYWGSGVFESLSGELGRVIQGLPEAPLDWKWLPNWWENYCRAMGRPKTHSPIVVRVCMLPSSTEQQRVSTEQWAFPVVIERRSQAKLCSTKIKTSPLVGGLSIGVQGIASGTLGGIVADQKKVRYALTCAHLAKKGDSIEQPARTDDKSAQEIGCVIADSQLRASTISTPCHPKNPLSRLNGMDAALVQLNDKVPANLEILTLGKLTRVLPEMDINPGDSICFVGKESGPRKRELVVGGLNVVFRFSDDGVNFFSFANTFQVEWPSAAVTPRRRVPVERGDSGAWLCAPDGHLHAWVGVAIGSHRDIGYALFAEGVMEWVDQQLKTSRATIC